MSCPRCESSRLNWIGKVIDGDYYYSVSQCEECKTIFQDVYGYIKTEIIVDRNILEIILDKKDK